MNTLIKKEFDIDQSIDIVWKSLADPEDIVGCVPGASITEKIDEHNYKGEVVTRFGPIKAAYAGDIKIVELDVDSRKMVLKGRGLDSKGKGSADMIMNGLLSERDGKTHVNFSMDITIVGMLAQFGSRLINDVSDQLLNQFVKNFQNKLNAENPPEAAPAVAEPAAGAAESTLEAVEAEVGTVAATATAPTKSKAAPQAPPPPVDNSLNAFSLIGTVLKSVLNSILALFGLKK
ncbi:MAG: SRPBCC family protein [Bacteroidota bacterium]